MKLKIHQSEIKQQHFYHLIWAQTHVGFAWELQLLWYKEMEKESHKDGKTCCIWRSKRFDNKRTLYFGSINFTETTQLLDNWKELFMKSISLHFCVSLLDIQAAFTWKSHTIFWKRHVCQKIWFRSLCWVNKEIAMTILWEYVPHIWSCSWSWNHADRFDMGLMQS